MVNDGNASLKPYTSYQAYFTGTWSIPLLSLWVNGGLSYIPDVIMTTFRPVQQDDGTYMIASLPENQRAYYSKWHAPA